MKIIFSPTKLQSTNNSSVEGVSQILFKEKTNILLSELTSLSEEDIIKMFKVSPAKAQEIYSYYQNSEKICSAFDLFNGISFKQLEKENYTTKHLTYAQNNVCILSALYGVVRPLDLVLPYRLDMNDSFAMKNIGGKKLYNFWDTEITEYFKDEECIINLASAEYSKLITQNYTGKIVNIHFLIEKKKYKNLFQFMQKSSAVRCCIT